MEAMTAGQAKECFDDMLDELHEPVFGIMPSRILSECDPIRYRCEFNDYIDSLQQDGIEVEGY